MVIDNIPSEDILEDEEFEVCEYCGGSGKLVNSEFDDVSERTCPCKLQDTNEIDNDNEPSN